MVERSFRVSLLAFMLNSQAQMEDTGKRSLLPADSTTDLAHPFLPCHLKPGQP